MDPKCGSLGTPPPLGGLGNPPPPALKKSPTGVAGLRIFLALPHAKFFNHQPKPLRDRFFLKKTVWCQMLFYQLAFRNFLCGLPADVSERCVFFHSCSFEDLFLQMFFRLLHCEVIWACKVSGQYKVISWGGCPQLRLNNADMSNHEQPWPTTAPDRVRATAACPQEACPPLLGACEMPPGLPRRLGLPAADARHPLLPFRAALRS